MLSSPDPLVQIPPNLRQNTASSLFSKLLPGVQTKHKMELATAPGDTIVVDTSSSFSTSNSSTSFEVPSTQSAFNYTHSGQDEAGDREEQDDSSILYTPLSKSGRRLRERKTNMSLKALENGDSPRKRSQSENKKKGNAIAELTVEDMDELSLTPVISSRVAIRKEIEDNTAVKRNRFLVEKRDYWLPLLPSNNHVRKLLEKHQRLSEAEISRIPSLAEYEEIERQPQGIKATMKPYQ